MAPGRLRDMSIPTVPRRAALAAPLGAVTAGSMLANLCAYLVHVPAGRWLGPVVYGEFAALLAALLVLGVPALALQAVVAREVVRGRAVAELWRLVAAVTAVVLIASVVAIPILQYLLDTSAGATAAAVATAPALAVIAGAQGILQGRAAFGPLSLLLAGVGVARSVPVVVVLAAGAGATGALLAGTVGALIAAVAGYWMTRPRRAADGPLPARVTAAGVLRASGVQLVLVVAVSLDLLAARAVLPEVDAGVYALGAVATKAAFWLPQAVGVVFYPRLADPATSGRSLRQAVGTVAAVGVVLTAAAGAAGPLVPLVISEDYRPVAPWLWLFALTGSMLAILQVVLLSAIAADRTRAAIPACAVLIAEVVVIAMFADSVVGLASIAAGSAAVSVVVTGLWLWWAGRRAPAETPVPVGG